MKLKLGLSFLLVVAAICAANLLVSISVKQPLQHDIILALIDIVIGGLAAIFLSSYLTRNLKELTRTTATISQGDLTTQVKIASDDEIGELSRSFNKMLSSLLNVIHEVRMTSEKMHDMAKTVSTTAEKMNASTEEISEASGRILNGAVTQVEMVKKTSGIMKDLALSTEEISEKARLALSSASHANDIARQGENFAHLATERINDAAKSIEKASRIVDGFRGRALEINKIVDFIASLSQQTHLLALNATIEAAKAGDNGKGFTVVAEEIRKLAGNVRGFAEQISKISQEINNESSSVMDVMDTTVKVAVEGKSVVLSAGRSLDDIINAVISTSDRMQEITIQAEKQVKGAEALVKAIEEIARIAEGSAQQTRDTSLAVDNQHSSMKMMSESAAKLARTSDQLKDLIALFRIQ